MKVDRDRGRTIPSRYSKITKSTSIKKVQIYNEKNTHRCN